MEAEDIFPQSFDDILGTAERFTEKLIQKQDGDSLLAAVWSTVHAREWMTKWKDVKFDQFPRNFPAWNTLKDICNGTKHAKRNRPTFQRRQIEWEDLDFWDNAGHGDRSIWFVEHEGQQRAVSSLCLEVIAEYRKRHG